MLGIVRIEKWKGNVAGIRSVRQKVLFDGFLRMRMHLLGMALCETHKFHWQGLSLHASNRILPHTWMND